MQERGKSHTHINSWIGTPSSGTLDRVRRGFHQAGGWPTGRTGQYTQLEVYSPMSAITATHLPVTICAALRDLKGNLSCRDRSCNIIMCSPACSGPCRSTCLTCLTSFAICKSCIIIQEVKINFKNVSWCKHGYRRVEGADFQQHNPRNEGGAANVALTVWEYAPPSHQVQV
jgi:hypothetical protein